MTPICPIDVSSSHMISSTPERTALTFTMSRFNYTFLQTSPWSISPWAQASILAYWYHSRWQILVSFFEKDYISG